VTTDNDHPAGGEGGDAGNGDGATSTRRRRGRRGGAGRSDGARSEQKREEELRPAGNADLPIASRRPGRQKAEPVEQSPAPEPALKREPVRAETPAAKPASTASRRRGSAATAEPEADSALGERIAALTAVVEELRAEVSKVLRRDRVGVFVDVPNLLYGAERGDKAVDVGKLLQYLTRQRELIRATAYAPVSDNPAEPIEQQRFVAPFVPYPYRIVTKSLKRFADGSIKGNFDVEMAIDMVMMADRIDVACIVSGDADFAKVVEILQQRGVRVEVVAFANSSSVEMRALADEFIELGAIITQIRP